MIDKTENSKGNPINRQSIRFGQLDSYVQELLRADYPGLVADDLISNELLLPYRLAYLNQIIEDANDKNDQVRQSVTSVTTHNQAYEKLSAIEQWDQKATFGQRVADDVARFGGSWTFIISFVVLMIIWMLINSLKPFGIQFDAYPFILLNLALSTIAAIQAPLIMMSQNRASDYDRLQAKNDFMVNQKSEAGVRLLHEKVDHLVQQDQSDLLRIQKLQAEMLVAISQQLNDIEEKVNQLER